MSVIRLLEGEEFEEYAHQSLDAYPVMMEGVTPEQRKGWVERMKKTQIEGGPTHSYGVFREGVMVGGARYHDFEMNVHGTVVKAGGVANIFVDLLHKKEHVAKDLMEHFHAHYRREGAPLAALYPFRPDFYRRMGYGYGRKLNKYVIKPSDLSSYNKRARLLQQIRTRHTRNGHQTRSQRSPPHTEEQGRRLQTQRPHRSVSCDKVRESQS